MVTRISSMQKLAHSYGMIWPQQTMTIRLALVFWVMPDTENYERKTGHGERQPRKR